MARRREATQQRYLESLVGTLTGWNQPEARLSRAFENDEFMLFGQSIVPLDARRNKPFRLEILIRLREEERNLTPPGAFLPILEYFDMMPALDRWVIEHAASWWRARDGVPNTVLNINISADTLDSTDFPGFVEGQLKACGLAPGAVCFELSGHEVASGSGQALAAATRLKALGCEFAVSAFGRDAISFDALRMVGASMVKVDAAMVRESHADEVALTNVRSIQRMCSQVGVATAAEFVELTETLDKLRGIGIDYAQGYGVARPEPLPGIARFEAAAAAVA